MELIYWYAFLAFVVAVISTVDLYWPTVTRIDDTLTYKGIILFTLFLISLLIAPLLVYPCLSPTKGLEFRDALLGALTENKKD